MNKTRDLVVVVVVALLVALAVNYFIQPRNSEPSERLGAIPGDTVTGSYFSIGGVEMAYLSAVISATSSVPCSFGNPFTSTSSIMSFSARFTDTPVAATTLDLSTSSTKALIATSATKLIHARSVKANGADYLLWQPGTNNTTTPAVYYAPTDGVSPYILRADPKDYLGLKVATSTPGNSTGSNTDIYAGSCSAVFQRL